MTSATGTVDFADAALRIAAAAPQQLLIGGEWRPASDGATLEVNDPATGRALTSIAAASPDDATAAVDAAAEAGPAWAACTARHRSEVLRRAFELMTAEADDVARLIVAENGKAMSDALGETAYAAEFFRWYAEEAVRNAGTLGTAPGGTNRMMVMHQPIGVSLLVTPWNFPAAMATRKIGPALAAGCSVILKPASETPLTALKVADILQRAGVPDGVVNVLPTNRTSAVVSHLMADDRVRKLSFTGSTEVGRVLLRLAADRVVHCSMELGGNAPFIVFDDADIARAVAGAMVAKMRNGGQACTAANRFYVHRTVVDEFTDRFAGAMQALTMGPGFRPGTDLGPVINAAAQESMVDAMSQLDAAKGSVVVGGIRPDGDGYFFPATVVRDVEADAPVLADELFGPIAPIVTFGPDDDVVEMANRTNYGLVGYVFTRDLKRAIDVSEALDYGMVGVNRGLVSDPAAPFGGTKESGLGREGGHEGMLEFTESKYLSVEW